MHLQLLNTAPEVWLKPAYAPVAYGSPPYVPSLRIVFAERRQARGLRHFLLRCRAAQRERALLSSSVEFEVAENMVALAEFSPLSSSTSWA